MCNAPGSGPGEAVFARKRDRATDSSEGPDGLLRRRILRDTTVAIGTLVPLTGCLGYRVVSSDELDAMEAKADEAQRNRIIDQYRDGLKLREVGSAHWHEGGDSWADERYGAAASHFDRAAGYYDAAALQFQNARDLSGDGGFDRAESICERSGKYCGELSDASGRYSAAARAFGADDESTGERLREGGWESYNNALDYEIESISSLKDSLEERGEPGESTN